MFEKLYKERHLVSVRHYSCSAFLELFRIADEMELCYNNPATRPALRHFLLVRDQHGKKIIRRLRFRILYGAPSSRTLGTGEDAIEILGGTSISQQLEYSSMKKGETYRSTAREFGPRCDGIIIRDDKNARAPYEMADAIEEYGLKTVIITAGHGNEEHPIQTFKDLYTIQRLKRKEFEEGSLVYALVGDFSNSRTIHSLLIGLKKFGAKKVYLVGTRKEDLPQWLWKELADAPFPIEKVECSDDIASEVDVWYFTRLQWNLQKAPLHAFLNAASGGRLKKWLEARYGKKYGASEDIRRLMKPDAICLHPLPHGPELSERIDLEDKRFVHRFQSELGLFIWLAVLKVLFARNVSIKDVQFLDGTARVKGVFSAVEVPNQDITAVCVTPGCLKMLIRGNDWGSEFLDVEEKKQYEGRVAGTFCNSCQPKSI